MNDHPQDAVPSPPPHPADMRQPPRPPVRYEPGSFNTLYWTMLGLYLGGLVLSIILIGIAGIIAALVLQYIFLFKAWNQIQDGHARTGPGKAVGFMFIPFFNFYWIFVAIYGLSQDLNRYMDERNIHGRRCSTGLAQAACIVALLSIIPYLGLLIALAAIPLWLMTFNDFRKASMAIAESA